LTQVVAEAKQRAEGALIKLHKRLLSTASLRDGLDTAAAADNPYLAPPSFEVLPAGPAAGQPAAKVQRLMPIDEGASQRAFSAIIGDAAHEGHPEGDMQEFVGWAEAQQQDDGARRGPAARCCRRCRCRCLPCGPPGPLPACQACCMHGRAGSLKRHLAAPLLAGGLPQPEDTRGPRCHHQHSGAACGLGAGRAAACRG
jgi:hypothetical protein